MPSGSTGAAGNQIPKGYSAGRLQQYTPEQMSLYQSLFPYVSPGSGLSEMAQGSDKGFAPYEDYANRQFQEQTGQLASRFSGGGGGQGAMSARKGSGFQNQATQGAQDFASNLAMQRQQLQRQALQDLMGLSGDLLGQHPYENFLTKKAPGFWQSLAGGLGETAGIVPSAFMASKGFGTSGSSGGGGSAAQMAKMAMMFI